MLQTWNMTVQYWLAVNVYRRLPGLSRGLRSLVVMVVSSAWHGVYPGMYIKQAKYVGRYQDAQSSDKEL